MTTVKVSLHDLEWRESFVPDQKLYIFTEGIAFPTPCVVTYWGELKGWLEAALEDAEEIDAGYEAAMCESDFYKYFSCPLDGGEITLWHHYLAMSFLQEGFIYLDTIL